MANKSVSANKANGLQIGNSTLVVTSDGKKSRVRKENVEKKGLQTESGRLRNHAASLECDNSATPPV